MELLNNLLAVSVGANFTKESLMERADCLAYLFNIKKSFEEDLTGRKVKIILLDC